MLENKSIEVSKGYRNYVLFMLMIVYAFNFIDRQILIVLQEPIKKEFGLSDLQLGIMTGPTFAIFYVFMGLPIARLADHKNRRNIVAIALGFWSTMTVLTGFAQNFVQVLLARIGLGIGQAGGSPPSHSLLSDYFPPEQRSTAFSIYSTGIYLGIMISYLSAGLIEGAYGWRMAFIIIGLPGVIFALILRFTIKEPKRGFYEVGEHPTVPLKEVLKHYISCKTMVYLSLAGSMAAFVSYSSSNFMPAYLSRVHHMSTAEIGISLAIAIGIGGGSGMFLSGFLADKLGRKDIRWYLWMPALASAIGYPLVFYVFLSDNSNTIIFVFFFAAFLNAAHLGPSIAICHSLSKPAMRALVSAILFFTINIIGLGLGPMTTGALSDYLSASYGAHSVRYAIVIVHSIGSLTAITLFFLAGKNLAIDSKKPL